MIHWYNIITFPHFFLIFPFFLFELGFSCLEGMSSIYETILVSVQIYEIDFDKSNKLMQKRDYRVSILLFILI